MAPKVHASCKWSLHDGSVSVVPLERACGDSGGLGALLRRDGAAAYGLCFISSLFRRYAGGGSDRLGGDLKEKDAASVFLCASSAELGS